MSRLRVLTLAAPFHPKYSLESRSPAVTKGGTQYYPMWLGYATGVLLKDGFQAHLVDAAGGCKTHDEVMNFVRRFNPDLTVIHASTGSVFNDAKVAAEVKDLSGSHTCLVGPHVTATPQQTLRSNAGVDSVARGEYDYIVRDLARELEKSQSDLSNVSGLSYKTGDDKIVHNDAMPLIDNLDEIPWVSKVYAKFLDIWDYFYSANLYPEVQIVTGRGCPYRCTYCHWPQTMTGRTYRGRSVDDVLDEFDYIAKTFPEVLDGGEVFLEDDTFTLDRKRVQEFARKKVERGNPLTWSGNARADVDLETLNAMKKAKCRLVCVGVESGNQQVLNNIKKGTTVEGIRKFFANAHKANVLVHGCFMLGNKGDTEETVRETIHFAKELNPDTAQFFPLMVYPGTEAYEWAKSEGILAQNPEENNFESWLNEEGGHNATVNLPGIKYDRLVQLCNDARSEYYFRPNYMATKARQVLTEPTERRRILKAFQVFIKQLGK